jgi:glycosyltransferase involved in cell wall biosynthesis
MHLMIITPIFSPSTGGAAIYYDLLSRELLERGVVSQVTVVTEKTSGESEEHQVGKNACEVVRIFPYRASGTMGKVSQFFRYAIQNLQYGLLLRMIRERRPNLVLVHSSFHNYANLLSLTIRRVVRLVPVIADVRDHEMPVGGLHQLEDYCAVIACSLNVIQHVSKRSEVASRIVHIPVLQREIDSPRMKLNETLEKQGIQGEKYLLFAGLIKREKGVQLLIDAYEKLRMLGYKGRLVLAGISKDRELLQTALDARGISVLGGVDRSELLDLMAGSEMVVHLSRSESLGRVCLEALELGIKTLLPKGIPEFEEKCSEYVVRSSEPVEVARQMMKLLEWNDIPQYPIGDHHPNSVVPKYEELFSRVLAGRL